MGDRHSSEVGIGEGGSIMQSVKIVVWQEDSAWLGYLEEYPDYWTQGETLDDLKEQLRELQREFASETIRGVRRVEELIVS